MDTTALSQLARRMLSSTNGEEVAHLLREGVCHVTGGAEVSIFLWDAPTGRLRPAAPGVKESLQPDPEVTDAAFREAEPITVPHSRGGFITAVPMRVGDRRIGLLALDVSELGPLDPDRLATVILLAEHAATALSSQRAIEETRGQFALLNNVLESITNGIVTIDAERRVVLMNRNAMAMLGAGTPKPRVALADAVPAPVADAVGGLIQEIRDQGFCMERRVTLKSAGGEDLPLAVSLSPLRDPVASNVGFIIVLRDMTASEELERLRHLDELKSQFVANVSHELKTPLTSIKAYTEALIDMVAEEQPKQFLKVIDEESDRLLYLINDLLNVSRIQSGRLKMHLEMTAPGALVQEVLKIARVQSEKHEVVVDVAADLPEMLLDRDKIKEVLINLLSNAVKYSPKGGRVWLRLKKLEGNLQIEVQDEGMGIAPENRSKLFQAFYRVDNSSTYEVSGTGLGLAIVKAIVDHHGGRVWVESEVGHGSTFYALLPIRTEARREEEASLRG
ncbi:MAG: GAF domain-containing protein [Planctomycetes bacterium]|nr:GAF domain-containing protein [Planctomycetota bacterium]